MVKHFENLTEGSLAEDSDDLELVSYMVLDETDELPVVGLARNLRLLVVVDLFRGEGTCLSSPSSLISCLVRL